MADVTMRQMLEAGVHFGHQTRYWNPKMAPFIFGERNKIHIINLEQTLRFIGDHVEHHERQVFTGHRLVCGPPGINAMFRVQGRPLLQERGILRGRRLQPVGLELEPRMLWRMRRPMLGLGGMQVLVTAVALAALGLAMGLTSIGLSWRYKMPIITAWSTPGAAVLVTSLAGTSLAEATGDKDAQGSYSLALRNMYPNSVEYQAFQRTQTSDE